MLTINGQRNLFFWLNVPNFPCGTSFVLLFYEVLKNSSVVMEDPNRTFQACCPLIIFKKKYENSVERCVILHVVSCHLQLLLVFIKKESTELLTDSFHNDGRQVQ